MLTFNISDLLPNQPGILPMSLLHEDPKRVNLILHRYMKECNLRPPRPAIKMPVFSHMKEYEKPDRLLFQIPYG